MYIAVTYIGTEYTPGEVLPDSLDAAFVKRLLKSGAIREDAPEAGDASEAQPETVQEPAEAPAAAVEPDDEAEAAYEEPDAPEIDVMDALVEPEKPKKRGKAK